MSRRARILTGVAGGLALGAAAGWLVGRLAQSDNAPFFIALGALAGLWGGLAWARVSRPLVLGAIALLSLLLLAVVFTPPRAPIQAPAPATTALTAPTPRPDGLTPDQAATRHGGWKPQQHPQPRPQHAGLSLPTQAQISRRRPTPQWLQRSRSIL